VPSAIGDRGREPLQQAERSVGRASPRARSGQEHEGDCEPEYRRAAPKPIRGALNLTPFVYERDLATPSPTATAANAVVAGIVRPIRRVIERRGVELGIIGNETIVCPSTQPYNQGIESGPGAKPPQSNALPLGVQVGEVIGIIAKLSGDWISRSNHTSRAGGPRAGHVSNQIAQRGARADDPASGGPLERRRRIEAGGRCLFSLSGGSLWIGKGLIVVERASRWSFYAQGRCQQRDHPLRSRKGCRTEQVLRIGQVFNRLTVRDLFNQALDFALLNERALPVCECGAGQREPGQKKKTVEKKRLRYNIQLPSIGFS